MLALVLLLAAAAPPDLTAVGVVLARAPQRSVAILRSGGQGRVVAVGDEAFGGRLVSVAADSVSMEFDGEQVGLRVSAAPGTLRPARAALRRNASAPLPAAPARVMERAEVQRRLDAEIPRILAETAVRPVTEHGRVVGLRLTRVPADSLLTDVGLQAGDVLTSINGEEIDGMAALIGLWPRLQGATDLRAEVRRDGRPFNISLSLK